MWQTSTPFLEFYINGVDILRSADGKPRTLISFTHNNALQGNGGWELEVFDPSYVAIEELLFVMSEEYAAGARATAEESYGESGSNQDVKAMITHPAMFRYGYISQDGKVIAVPQTGEEFFVGTVTGFVPTYETNGTYLHIEGQILGPTALQKKRINTAFYDKDITAIVKDICRRMDWILVPFGEPPGTEELPEGKEPEPLLTPSSSIETTEEQPVTYRIEENQDPYTFLQTLLMDARSKDPKYGNYMCRLEYRASGVAGSSTGLLPDKPQGYLYYGPLDALATPVRNYVFMRDPLSDVITYSPSVAVAVIASTTGGSLIAKTDDKRLGEQEAHEYTEVDRYLKFFTERRDKVTFSLPEIGAVQEGKPEEPKNERRIEIANTGPRVYNVGKKYDTEKPGNEMSVHITDRFLADRQIMDFYNRVNMYADGGSLVIFGDPSPEITPTANVTVFVLVPTKEDKLRIHWVSAVWSIIAVVHSIQGGQYTTTLELTKSGTLEGGVFSKAAYNTFLDSLDAGALKKLS